MLNIQAIFRETIKAIKENKELLGDIEIQQLQKELTIEVEGILRNICDNLADIYPQAPIVGGTPKMKEVLIDVNRTDD